MDTIKEGDFEILPRKTIKPDTESQREINKLETKEHVLAMVKWKIGYYAQWFGGFNWTYGVANTHIFIDQQLTDSPDYWYYQDFKKCLNQFAY